jgi:hypothetical protein
MLSAVLAVTNAVISPPGALAAQSVRHGGAEQVFSASVVSASASVVSASAAVVSASAATPLTGEALTGAGPTTSGYGYGSCTNRNLVQGGDGFNLSGTASGPYPGAFSATGGFSVYGHRNPPFQVRFSAKFTITSGTTKITGSISTSYRGGGVFWLGIGCTPTGTPSSYSTGSFLVNYTAAINGQTYQGTGKVGGTFATQIGAQTSVGASLTG